MSESGIKMGEVEDPGLSAELVSGLTRTRGVTCVNNVLVYIENYRIKLLFLDENLDQNSETSFSFCSSQSCLLAYKQLQQILKL